MTVTQPIPTRIYEREKTYIGACCWIRFIYSYILEKNTYQNKSIYNLTMFWRFIEAVRFVNLYFLIIDFTVEITLIVLAFNFVIILIWIIFHFFKLSVLMKRPTSLKGGGGYMYDCSCFVWIFPPRKLWGKLNKIICNWFQLSRL